MYIDELEHIAKKLKEAEGIIETVSKEQFEQESLETDISKLINVLSDALLKAKTLPREFGIKFDYEAVETKIDIEEMTDDNGEFTGYHFVLPCLLDKRESNNIYSKTREHAKKCFNEAFKRYSDEVGFKRISVMVGIHYINHFKDTRSMIDNDNVDTKAFTDMITTYILNDDNPDYSDLFIKGVADGESYTEVYVEMM